MDGPPLVRNIPSLSVFGWQRGCNENTNGLLRQYFPKRTDLSVYSQSDLDKVALRLNQCPRKTLGFETPASRLRASVAATH
jgi:IS30 family transposase